jgi:hypothetical protein
MPCRRVVFTGDFLRPSWDGRFPTQHYNIQWCRDLLRAQVQAATGLPVEMLAWNAAGVVAGQLDNAAIDTFYNVLGLPRTVAAWAGIYEEAALPDMVGAYLAELFRDALVVAFELPPYVEHVLRRHGIPFVDVIIHPVRFLDDIFFAIRTGDADSNARVATYAIAEEQIHAVAGLQAASARRLFKFAPQDGSALLLLQTRFDRTQIRDGVFVGAMDFLDGIDHVVGPSRRVYVKDHPLDPKTRHAVAVLSRFRNAETIESNVYKLFACDGIHTVLTLSSSTGIEARYFGKQCHFLYRQPNEFAFDGAVPADGEFVGVFDAFLTPDFWRDVLAPMVPTTRETGVVIPFKPNRLRISLRSFWNFNEIDSDFVVGLAPGTTPAKPAPATPARSKPPPPPPKPTLVLPKDLRPELTLAPHSARRGDNVIEIGPGEAGHGVYGPYLPLDAGTYRAAVRLEADVPNGFFSRPTGAVVVDVVADGGRERLTERRLPIGDIKKGSDRQQIEFQIPASSSAVPIELRVWTDGRHRVLVCEAVLERVR